KESTYLWVNRDRGHVSADSARGEGYMKLRITRDNLQQGLAAVGASIPTRTTLPVLSNILIDVGPDSIAMSGTDLDIAVSVNVPAEVEEQGSLTVPAKKLQELARELPEH